jgi:sulfate transport system ATP-binding protein
MRPHLLEVHRHPEGEHPFRATLQRVTPAGAVVRLDLVTEWGDPVQVELSRERARQLALEVGETVYLAPREVRVFGAE